MGPLTGLKIIELAGLGPGPWCGMLFSDLGAEVLRIDRPSDVGAFRTDLGAAGGRQPAFVNDRGRHSVAIDLKHPDGAATVLRLAGQADALIEGNRPGVTERLGVGPAACFEHNPQLVYGRATGWGQDGPLSDQTGHDLNYLATSGLLAAMGPAGGTPAIPLNLLGDFAGGGLMLAMGVLSALWEARNSGHGQVVDAAMLDGIALLGGIFYGQRQAGMLNLARGTNALDGGAPFYTVYETSDAGWMAVGAIEAKFFAELLDVLGLDPGLASSQWTGVRGRSCAQSSKGSSRRGRGRSGSAVSRTGKHAQHRFSTLTKHYNTITRGRARASCRSMVCCSPHPHPVSAGRLAKCKGPQCLPGRIPSRHSTTGASPQPRWTRSRPPARSPRTRRAPQRAEQMNRMYPPGPRSSQRESSMGMSLNFVTDSVVSQMPAVDPHRPAVALGTEPALNWEELRAAELRYARALQKAGLQKGDRIGILLRNCTDYIALYLAIGRVGGIAVRLNWRLSGPELQFALADSQTSLLVLDSEFCPAITSLRDDVPVSTYVVRGPAPDWAIPLSLFADEESDASGFPPIAPEDPVSLMYSSGTTGRPKGVLFSHSNALWTASIQVQRWRIGERTVAQTSGPLFHAGGFEVLLLPALTAHGTAVVFPSGGFRLDSFLAAGRANGTTNMLLYPFMLFDLLRRADLDEQVPTTLKRIVTGGDVVMPWVYDELERRLPGVELVQSYSLTEGGAVSTSLEFDVARDRETSIGRPQAMTEVKVIRPDGSPTNVDEVGEICVRSGGVSIGYWNRPDANETTFVDGWCRSGDLGRVDTDGFLTMAGRAKDMYRSGGENVYPAEVEMALTSHADIDDAAVIGVPDQRYVEVGAAIIVVAEGRTIDPDALRAWLAEQLAKYKVPKQIHLVDELPRNASGKIRKNVLRENYGPSESC